MYKRLEYALLIQSYKTEVNLSRQDRDIRRRKVILELENAQNEQQKRNLEDQMVSKLLRQSKQERRMTEQYFEC